MEVAVGISIIFIALIGFTLGTRSLVRVSSDTAKESQATFLLEEGAEIIRALRDESWSSIQALNDTGLTKYYFNWVGAAPGWAIVATNTMIPSVPGGPGVFSRSMTVHQACRNGSDDLITCGVAPDPNADAGTRRFKIDVAWKNRRNATTTRSVELYLTNFFNE